MFSIHNIDLKTKQWIVLGSIVGVISFGIGILTMLLLKKSEPVVKVEQPQKTLITGASRLDQQEIWVHKFGMEAELTKKRLENMEQMLENLLKLNAAKEDPVVPENSINNLRQEVQALSHPVNTMPVALGDAPLLSFRSKALQKITLNLPNTRSNKALKTNDNTIPAGAFAKVILLGGVDASTSIQASSDPRPVLLRLLDPGTLPRKFSSDLEGCHVLAASYGDLSSERVFMRLEKLTCLERRTGEVLEMSVQGYVAGEDGKAGLRGNVVDRAGESMRNAMIGGFFSGIGNFLSQARNPVVFAPATGLSQTNPLTTQEVFQQSASKGAGTALEKYADFYIKRAEQMQPVIQIAAGRSADVVFTRGVEFMDSAVRQTLSKVHDQKRFQEVHSLEAGASGHNGEENGKN